MVNNVLIDCNILKEFVSELFKKINMPDKDAEWFAETLVTSNLRGVDSHGVWLVPTYVDRILCGAMNPMPNITVEELAPSISMVEADDASGCVPSKLAMEIAVKKAKEFGIALVAVKNSNHFGAASNYAQMAVDEGMIGFASSNVPTMMTAPGAKRNMIGNNPFAVGIPTYCDYPFMLDMALSVVAQGKLRVAIAKEQKIPTSWAVDQNGIATDDPTEALKGFLLPVGGFKGLGLAYVIDILCGMITNGVFADKICSMFRDPEVPSKLGHMMAAINLEAFITKDEMKERMEYFHNYILSAPLVEGAPKLCFPGEIEYNTEIQRRKEGIPLPPSVFESLIILKEKYDFKSNLH